jgi:hypothetical protein
MDRAPDDELTFAARHKPRETARCPTTTYRQENEMTDEQQIRTLIERWAIAAHAGDIEGVLADHAPEIVMFDVPPPFEGVRGIASYRDSWPDASIGKRVERPLRSSHSK